jgi:hypothetical protein
MMIARACGFADAEFYQAREEHAAVGVGLAT